MFKEGDNSNAFYIIKKGEFKLRFTTKIKNIELEN